MLKKLTIIVPVYNIDKYLEKCIESLLVQTYENLFVILVDDGSSDTSGRICDDYAFQYGNVTAIHQKNGGPTSARLTGVKAAQSEYITFVDGDDWVAPDFYENILGENSTEVDIISYGYIAYNCKDDYSFCTDKLDEGIYKDESFQKEVIPNMYLDEKTFGWNICPSLWSKIMRKSIVLKELERVQKLKIHYGEDMAVIYPALLHSNSIQIIKQCLYYYRKRPLGEKAPYFQDSLFQQKLYSLYDYMKDQFISYPNLLKQTEKFYMYAIKLQWNDSEDDSIYRKYLFPFDRVKQGSRIVLYGAGKVGQAYKWQIERINYCKVVGWIDRNYEQLSSRQIESVDNINDMVYDVIVIAIASGVTAKYAMKNLEQMGVEKDKFVWDARMEKEYING